LKKLFFVLLVFSANLLAFNPVKDAYRWIAQEYREFRTYPRIDRAYRLIRDGKELEAKKLLEKSLEIDPSSKEALVPLISLCLNINDKECILKYEEFIKTSELAYFYLYRASKRYSEGEYKKAVINLQEALAHNLKARDRMYAKLLLIESYIKLGDFDNASSYINRLYYSKNLPKLIC